MRLFQSTDSNCRPLSVVIVVGTPNLAIHPLRNALATTSADIAVMGIASGHLVKRSMQVRRYVYPCEVGRGPTRSMCMESNLALGGVKVHGCVCSP